MPAPTPFAPPSATTMLAPFPALYLYPLNADSFVKHINLTNNQRVKIGRQTNARTVPAENNGYFDSKVLSRQHAEVWEENAKIFIKDVKSSNGTFINGERLSPEGLESQPYELKSDDIVEFGIDIVGEDNKTIIHHKVAARVVCVFSEQDAHVAARAEQHQHQLQQQQQQQHSQHQQNPATSPASGAASGLGGRPPQPNGSAAFSFVPGSNTGARRPPMQPQGLGGMGGMGAGSVRAPGKSGLTFDHILSRLQGELQKSRETGAELHNLTGAMNDIHDTLGGSLPPNLPPYPSALPPVRPSTTQNQDPPEPSTSPPALLAELQSQLHDTQSSLANHVDKVRALETVFAEHDAIKREVGVLRQLVEKRDRENEDFGAAGGALDDDDARSIRTIVPHELERVEEEDEDQITKQEQEQHDEDEEEERRTRRVELGRPRTPEPMSLGMTHDEEDIARSSSPRQSVIDELFQRLTTLSSQLESAIELSSSLQAQHAAAQSTISVLESKVSSLESLVQQSQVSPPPAAEPAPPHPDTLTQMLNDWKKSVEGQWSSVREEWASERERLASAREEWESKVKSVETNLGTTAAKFDAGLASLAVLQRQQQHAQALGLGNGEIVKGGFHGSSSGRGGLVTPPSPRSLSADSNRPRQRRKRTSSSRGRGRSTSIDVIDRGAESESSTSSTHASLGRPYTPSLPDDSSDVDSLRKDSTDSNPNSLQNSKDAGSVHQLETPESSIHRVPVTSVAWTDSPVPDSLASSISKGFGHENAAQRPPPFDARMTTLSTAVGVVILSVAAAAVIWRVKPE
ncbi:hypothetical protein PILCRDRAFT_823052 [Piloderma croceum F 1598]|uniref:FHA domain-containing protein n=1 Tax=Piloderma croceum (strain F 1598) TaxID=765440 RepID=A0A0C3BRA9_PILCF|nr:hypothetical protein PILCRDRAFT_823052 [Piloderma croceum F 1598]